MGWETDYALAAAFAAASLIFKFGNRLLQTCHSEGIFLSTGMPSRTEKDSY
jgi:hypothetical protein